MMSHRVMAKSKHAVSVIASFTVILAGFILLTPTAARAHGVSVFAYAEGDDVVVEGYFHDGAKCKDCTVEAFDSQERKVAEGKTDAEGRFSFTAPARIDMLIRLSDPVGHRADYRFPASDLPDSLPAATEPKRGHVSSPAVERTPPEVKSSEIVDAEEIEDMIEKAVARQLEPIRRALEESQRQRRLSDVIGGIGYIAGVMGLILYFRSRQKH